MEKEIFERVKEKTVEVVKQVGRLALRGVSMHEPQPFESDHYRLPDAEGEALEPWDTQEIPIVEQ